MQRMMTHCRARSRGMSASLVKRSKSRRTSAPSVISSSRLQRMRPRSYSGSPRRSTGSTTIHGARVPPSTCVEVKVAVHRERSGALVASVHGAPQRRVELATRDRAPSAAQSRSNDSTCSIATSSVPRTVDGTGTASLLTSSARAMIASSRGSPGEAPTAVETLQKHRSVLHIDVKETDRPTAIPQPERGRLGRNIVAGRREPQNQRFLPPTDRHHESVRPVHHGPVHDQAPIPTLIFHALRNRVQPLATSRIVPPARHATKRLRHGDHRLSLGEQARQSHAAFTGVCEFPPPHQLA